MSGIVWLASWPKSGNTWMRALLHNLRSDSGVPARINALDGMLASRRHLFDQVLGVEASDLTETEVLQYRPLVGDALAAAADDEPVLLKVHDAYRPSDDAPPVISKQATAAVLYLVRNPVDVCVSWAHHRDSSLDQALRDLCNPTFTLAAWRKGPHTHLPEVARDWSSHVRSWLEAPVPLHVVRYEDLIADAVQTFAEVVDFLGWSASREAVRQAVAHSRLEVLQAQERAEGFREKSLRTVRFFRKGHVGEGYEQLTPAQVAQLEAMHGATMRQLGYPVGEVPAP